MKHGKKTGNKIYHPNHCLGRQVGKTTHFMLKLCIDTFGLIINRIKACIYNVGMGILKIKCLTLLRLNV